MFRKEEITVMYSVAIVEDERLIGEKIKALLQPINQRVELIGQYLNGKKVTEDQQYGQKLLERTGILEVKEDEDYNLRYAVAVRRTDLKAFPTSDRFFDTADDTQFDNIQSSVMLHGEAAVVFFTTIDGEWCLVRTYNCSGVRAADLAMASRDQWMNYWEPTDYITITADRMEVAAPSGSGDTSFRLFMGTRLPHTSGNKVLIPIRDQSGDLATVEMDLGENADICIGALPYTRANVIRQAFKSLHLRYGWGGMFDARDCSSFVMDIYRCFGMDLARNTSWQPECEGKKYTFPDNSKKRLDLFQKMQPGTILFFSGHEMLYLGSVDGQPYIIHSLSSYSNDGEEKISANAVVVSDLNMLRAKTGKTFLDSLTVAVDFRKQ
jgi:cell wall-associated NlpC family hydrolase